METVSIKVEVKENYFNSLLWLLHPLQGLPSHYKVDEAITNNSGIDKFSVSWLWDTVYDLTNVDRVKLNIDSFLETKYY